MKLSRERLYRIFTILERQGGSETLRQLSRRFAFHGKEIEEAVALGWVTIETRKPPTGRPSRVVYRLSENQPAKLPPPRSRIEKSISHKHWKFAIYSVCSAVKGGGQLGFSSYVDAYQCAYPDAISREGAHASCSRLLRNPNIFAARQWLYAKTNGEIPAIKTPATETEIWEQLKEAGSWRARYAPTSTHRFREKPWY